MIPAPCPFCGMKPHIEMMCINEVHREYTVYCVTDSDDCRSIPDVEWSYYEDDAVEEWNAIASRLFHEDKRSLLYQAIRGL